MAVEDVPAEGALRGELLGIFGVIDAWKVDEDVGRVFIGVTLPPTGTDM